MKNLNIISNIRLLLLVLVTASCQQQKEIPLFDGKTLRGWECAEDVFRVENGCIVGGSLEKGLEESYYLCTTEEYSDFELSLSVKLIHKNLSGNSGISFRAKRVPGSNMVASYQADIGYIDPSVVVRASDCKPADMKSPFSLWGSIIDECREDISRYPDPDWYPGVLLKWPERDLIDEIVKPYDWNKVTVKAHGKEIEIKINGITTVKFTENLDVPGTGFIGLQAHSGEPCEVHFKDITIREID
jgi:hypothetical protein